MRQETFRLSQKELQRVAVNSSCVKGDLDCAKAGELLALTPRHVQASKRAIGKAWRRLWHTPAAAGSATAAYRSACETASSIWPAPPMPVSTTTTSVKNWSRRKASPSAARPSTVCCARPGSARPANAALRRIASAASRALARATCWSLTAASTAGSKIAAHNSSCSASWTTPLAGSRRRLVSHRRRSRLFRPAPPLVALLRRPSQFLTGSSRRLRLQR